MDNRYYKLPLDMTTLFEDGVENGLAVCSEAESIYQYLQLLISTCPGEHDFDKTFGSQIYDMDFENIVSRTRWEAQFTQYITETIVQNEKRINNVNVIVRMDDAVRQDSIFGSATIKKRAWVFVTATLVRTGEPCRFQYVLYLGPISTK